MRNITKKRRKRVHALIEKLCQEAQEKIDSQKSLGKRKREEEERQKILKKLEEEEKLREKLRQEEELRRRAEEERLRKQEIEVCHFHLKQSPGARSFILIRSC